MSKDKAEHCRIFTWIDQKDHEFAEAIRQLCLEGALTPSKKSAGVTFLYPADAKYRKEIIDKVWSGKEGEADEAEKMVRALIIPDYFPTGTQFLTRKSGNLEKVLFNVKAAHSGDVELGSGAKFKLSGWKSRGRNDGRIAVWELTEGRIPHNPSGELYEPPQSRVGGGRRRRVRHGGGPGGYSRVNLAQKVEAGFAAQFRKDRATTTDPYLAAVVSLMNYLKKNHAELYSTALATLDRWPIVSFYLLFEPYKTSGAYMVPTPVLGESGWNEAMIYEDAPKEFAAMFDEAAGQTAATATDSSGQKVVPLVFADRANVAARIDLERQQFDSAKRQAPGRITDLYAALEATNSIGGVGPVFPDAVVKVKGKKQWQDEFRFVVGRIVNGVFAGQLDYDELLGVVHRMPGNNYQKEICLTNKLDASRNIGPRAEILLLYKLIRSGALLYLAGPPTAGAGDPDNLGDTNLFDRDRTAIAYVGGISGMANPDGISAAAMNEIRHYAALHGALPPAVSKLVSQ